ncbi:MAG: T9SS type A sorting domain-containing protein [Melioribacteraceae bacterium]|nr:T9SS type A sorting domain-containing protein [Melioribacteraceae bacterium]MCF8354176.1 T9SS type A sorting domain-containing protein [Melioribacteraceae bacterium]MCF8394714.1 T9SS type A sorting domain-containing protein [Melioribacteraceae bacterium]MCF8418099.1 T9SS type A sorting domain-containing protein [Melioribacteraceae bacterium]
MKMVMAFMLINFTVSAQWTNIGSNLEENWMTGYCMDAIDSSTVLLSAAIDTLPRPLYLTKNGGLSWESIFTPTIWSANDVSIIDTAEFWFCYSNIIYHTSDGGDNWDVQFQNDSITNFINYIEMFDESNGIAMADAAVENTPAIILKTTDGGSNWISVNDSTFGWKSNLYLIDFVNPDTGFFFASRSTSGSLWKTFDGGYNWIETSLYMQPQNFPNSIDFYNSQIGIAGFKNDIKYTQDGGMTWENHIIDPGFTAVYDIEFSPGSPERIWGGGVHGLYLSDDSGENWMKISEGIHEKAVVRKIIFTDDNHGYVLCDSSRLYYISNAGSITSVEDVKKETLPTDFVLSQNYPNPFNPTTTIEFYIPSAISNLSDGKSSEVRNFKDFSSQAPRNDMVNVRLKVYDILGREVKTLLNKSLNSGRYKITFNADGLNSGVYFYQLTTGEYKHAKKMVLLR